VARGLVAALHDFPRELRVAGHRLADHVGGHLDVLAIPEVEKARDAFLDAVVVPGLDRQVRVSRIERREGAFRSPFRLGAGLELHGDGDGEACALRPERSFRVLRPAHASPPATFANVSVMDGGFSLAIRVRCSPHSRRAYLFGAVPISSMPPPSLQRHRRRKRLHRPCNPDRCSDVSRAGG